MTAFIWFIVCVFAAAIFNKCWELGGGTPFPHSPFLDAMGVFFDTAVICWAIWLIARVTP